MRPTAIGSFLLPSRRCHMLVLCCLGASEALAPSAVQTHLSHTNSPLRSSSPRLIVADPRENVARFSRQLDETPPPELVGSAAFAVPRVPSQYARRVTDKAIKASIAATFVASSAAALPAIGKWYSAAAIAAPVLTATTTAGIKGVASDLFAQIFVEGRSRIQDMDMRRTMAFASFGCLYCGAFASWKYNTFYTALFGAASTFSAVASKVSADMLWSAPFVYFPLYFIVKGLFNKKSPATSLKEFLQPAGLRILRQYWMVWLPVELVMWTMVPAHLRIAFICAVSLIWQVFLSTVSNKLAGADDDDSCPITYDSLTPADAAALADQATLQAGTAGSSRPVRSCVPVMLTAAAKLECGGEALGDSHHPRWCEASQSWC